MEYQEIVSLISSVGFPCVMSIILIKYVKELTANFITALTDVKDVVTKHTTTIQALCNKIEALENEKR